MKKYVNKKYMSMSRLQAYLEQFKLIGDSGTKKILEVGKGPGIFGSIVKSADYDYISVDHDINTRPHIVSDVTSLPLKDNSFDYVYCCQVLEHLTFDKFSKSISELCRIAKIKIIISLPDNRKYFRVSFHMPKLDFRKVITIPKTGKDITIETHGQHFWEIGDNRYENCVSKNEVLNILKDSSNIKTVSNYRFYERPYQHFYVLTKKTQQ